MTSTVADFYGVPGQGMVQQVDSITLSHTSPAALSKKGIISYPALETAQAAPTGDVITVFDVTTSTALVLNTDYTLTVSGTSPETLTYSVTRINTSSASSDGDTAKVTYRYGVQRLPQSGEFGGYAGTAPTGTQFQASTTDTEGASASGLGSAGGYGSTTDPAAGSQSSSETGSPGSEYKVAPAAPSTFGWPAGAPDTEGVYGGGLPSSFSPVLGANYSQGNIGSTADPGGLDTVAAGGSNLVPAEYGSPPGYRAPSSGVAAGTKDTTLTDILGNQQNATAASPPSGYAAAQVDTSYFGAPAAPTSLASQTDTFASTAAATRYYLTQQGLVASTIVVTDTTGSVTLVLNTDYTVTSAGNGATTVAYITLTAGTNYTAGDNISVAYSYGDATYWGSNVPSAPPGAPTINSVTAVNRGVSINFSPPSGIIPVDYYMVRSWPDLGTQYVPVTGQPVLDGQPSPSGGAMSGQPTYQGDALTLIAAALAAPSAPSGTGNTGSGSTLAAGNYKVIVTYTNANGETLGSASTTIAVTATDNLVINSPATETGATGWYAYVTQAGGSTYTRQQAAGSPTAISTNLTLTAPPTSTGANPPTLNTTLPTTSKAGVLTPPTQIIVRDVTSAAQSILTSGEISGGEGDPLQADGQVLEYGYDYTVTQVGTGPWTQYQVALVATSQNAAAGDSIIVEYWWGADPSTLTTVFTQALTENTPVIYKPDGTTPYNQGYAFQVAAGNRAGLSVYSALSAYAVPLNYAEAQPGHEGGITVGTGSLDPANTVNPIYKPDGTVKAGTGLGG
jgi:hypothetical protein